MASTIKVDKIEGSTGSTVTVPTGQTLAITDGLAASTIASGTLADARIPNLSAAKITTGTLANARVADLPTSKITSGTMADARISASSVTQHVAATDLTPVQHDIQTLALHSAIADNKAAYNLQNSYIDQFEDDTGLLTQTNGDRIASGEYWATVYSVSGAYASDSDTVFLLHFDNNVTDSSSNAYSFTNNGSTAFSTSYKKFGTHALSMDGSDDDVTATGLTGIGTGNFTVDWWANTNGTRTASAAERHFGLDMDGAITGGANPELDMGYSGGTNANQVNIHGDLQSPVDWTLTSVHATSTQFDGNHWVHHAIQRSGTTLYYFVDGIREGTNSCNANNVDGTFTVGGRSGGGDGERYTGFMDEFRLSSVARYSTSGSTGDVIFTPQATTATANATGTLICNTVTANAATTEVSGTVLYKNNAGVTSLNTDLTCEFSANNGSNWTASTMVAGGTFSTGILIAKCPKVTVTSGTQVKYRLVFANQASGSKETQIHGVALTY